MLAVVLGLLVASLAQPVVTGDVTLLGRLDVTTGVSSEVPPAQPLRLSWRRPVDPMVVASPVPTLVPLPADRVLIGRDVVDLDVGEVVLRYEGPLGAVSPSGATARVDDGVLQHVDVGTGRVLGRWPVTVSDAATEPWEPTGPAEAWVDGAAVFTDAAGRLGVVEPGGAVRWVLSSDVLLRAEGHGAGWLLVERDGRLLALRGEDGTPGLDVGPVSVAHAPVVAGETLVHVVPLVVGDPDLGRTVQVVGTSLDGNGRRWGVDLPVGAYGGTEDVAVTVTGRGDVVVRYPTAGAATTLAVLEPVAGTVVAKATGLGAGVTRDGWPVAVAAAETLVHVDPGRGELRALGWGGTERWSMVAAPGLGVTAVDDLLLVHTPATDLSRATRLRLFEVSTGRLRWDRVDTSSVDAVVAVALDGHVGVRVGDELVFHDVEDGRRRALERLLGRDLPDGVEATEVRVLGTLDVGGLPRPVLLGPDRVVHVRGRPPRTLGPREPSPGVPTVLPGEQVTRGDEAGAVEVSQGRVALRGDDGREAWVWEPPTALRPAATVLLADGVLVLDVAGTATVLGRGGGVVRWEVLGEQVVATAVGGGTTLLGTADGRVLQVGPDGDVVAVHGTGASAPVESLAVVDGRVVGTSGDALFGLGRGAWYVEQGDRVSVD